MLGGYMGKTLRIDLSKNEVSEDVFRKFTGGSGLGSKILCIGPAGEKLVRIGVPSLRS